jgi:dihydroorotate dehydrogenase
VEGVINRLGFNNDGVDHLLLQVSRTRYRGILGINIGKNFDTPMENAVDDYVNALRRVYPHAHYVTVNISSPNTRNLRELQGSDELARLLTAIKTTQRELSDQSGRYVPIALKIAPDLEPAQIDGIAKLLVAHGMDGVIATNTTISRSAIASHPMARETGGLSGAPLHDMSLAVVQKLAHALDGALPIIGVGGINSAARAKAMLDAGASLIQLYTGLIYKGPGLIDEILQGLA